MKRQKKTMKQLPKVDRPREKLMKYGPEKLSNAELLALFLRSGNKDQNVLELSRKILRRIGEKNLPQAKVEDFIQFPGIGPAKACDIVACFELGKRILKGKQAKLYMTPRAVWEALKDIRDKKKEHFVIFYLDSRHQEIKRDVISIGSVNASLVHPREVFEPAVQHLASQILLAHNHPSGDPEPSDADLEMTKRLSQAGKILGIEVIDHIIVTEKDYLSFKEQRLLYKIVFE